MIASNILMIFTAPNIMAGSGFSMLNNHALVTKNGIICAVAAADKIARVYSGHKIIDLKNSVLMPGLVNTHSHLELPSFLQTVHAKKFSDWVLNLIEAKRELSTNDYTVATRSNIEELIRTGSTTVGEICTHGISADLLAKSGLRGIVFQEIIDMNLNKSSQFRIQSSKNRRSAMILNGLSPHSPYTVSPAVLSDIRTGSRGNKLLVCMHVAESRDEIKLLQAKKSGLEKIYQFAGWDIKLAPRGRSSFDYLNKIGFLSPNLLAVHGVQVNNDDIRLIKKSKTCIAHCPRSNKRLGVGRMPLKKFLDAGITVGLGTDSLASSPNLNLWDEMRYALKIHKKDGITARDILKLATIGGAKALGLDKEIGTLEPGKKADIIAVPLPSKNTGDIYSNLLRETNSCIMNMVNGKILYLDADLRR